MNRNEQWAPSRNAGVLFKARDMRQEEINPILTRSPEQISTGCYSVTTRAEFDASRNECHPAELAFASGALYSLVDLSRDHHHNAKTVRRYDITGTSMCAVKNVAFVEHHASRFASIYLPDVTKSDEDTEHLVDYINKIAAKFHTAYTPEFIVAHNLNELNDTERDRADHIVSVLDTLPSRSYHVALFSGELAASTYAKAA